MKRKSSKSGKKGDRRKQLRVFLDIPYEKLYRPYENAIRAALLVYGLHPVAAKDIVKSSNLLADIERLIRSCKYALVDISGLKFNVGFEAGLIEARGLCYILFKNPNTKPPSDLQGIRYFEYSSAVDLQLFLIQWIKQNIRGARPIREQDYLADVVTKIMKKSQVDRETAMEMVVSILATFKKSGRALPAIEAKSKRRR